MVPRGGLQGGGSPSNEGSFQFVRNNLTLTLTAGAWLLQCRMRREDKYKYTRTDSSSDSASHTHSARRPSAAALLTRSRGGGLTPPPSHTPNSRTCVWVAGGLSPCECVCWVQLLSVTLWHEGVPAVATRYMYTHVENYLYLFKCVHTFIHLPAFFAGARVNP